MYDDNTYKLELPLNQAFIFSEDNLESIDHPVTGNRFNQQIVVVKNNE